MLQELKQKEKALRDVALQLMSQLQESEERAKLQHQQVLLLRSQKEDLKTVCADEQIERRKIQRKYEVLKDATGLDRS